MQVAVEQTCTWGAAQCCLQVDGFLVLPGCGGWLWAVCCVLPHAEDCCCVMPGRKGCLQVMGDLQVIADHPCLRRDAALVCDGWGRGDCFVP